MSERTMIERLEKLARMIERMLGASLMFAQEPKALEMSLLTAFEAWAIIIDSPLDAIALWREEILLAFPDSEGYSAVSLSYPPASMVGEGDATKQITIERIVYHGRRIWNQLKHTG